MSYFFYLVGHYGWGTEGSFEKKWEFELWIFAIGLKWASACYLRYYGKFTCCWLRWGKCPPNVPCVVLEHLILVWPFGWFHSIPYVRFALAQQELTNNIQNLNTRIHTYECPYWKFKKKINIDSSNECITIFIWPICLSEELILAAESLIKWMPYRPSPNCHRRWCLLRSATPSHR